ncbi:MAG: hypothetical protein ACLPVI_10035 [Dehalococcoidales bacterium]
MKRFYKTIIFPLKWIFMSSKARYAYLWAKTRKLAEIDYIYRDLPADTNN